MTESANSQDEPERPLWPIPGYPRAAMHPERKDTIADLKRTLLRLSQLDGVPLTCLEGLHLVKLRSVRQPAALLDAVWEQGGVSVAALARFAELERQPAHIEARWLAAAQRDLRVLEQAPQARELAAESKALRRYGVVDARWIAQRQERIDALSRLLSRPPAPAGPLEVVEAIRGSDAAQAIARWRSRSIQWAQERRRAAQRRVEAIAARLAQARADPGLAGPRSDLPAEMLDAIVARLTPRASRFIGPARAGLIHQILAEVVAWPEAPAHRPEEPVDLPADLACAARTKDALDIARVGSTRVELARAVRAAGAVELARIGSTRHANYVARLDRALALLALLYRPDPDGALSPRDVHRVLRELSSPKSRQVETGLTMTQGLELLHLRLSSRERDAVQDRVAKGLEIELVVKLLEAKQLPGLLELEDVDAVRAWGRWVLDLAPRLQARGVELKLPPSVFHSKVKGRDRELALFARAMLAAPADANEAPAARLARLDAVLAIVDKAPAQAKALHADLAGTDPGAGRRLFPEFAAWLDDDELLDRFCHLTRLAGEEPSLPRALHRDFARLEKLESERDFLAGLASPNAGQRARLAHVAGLLASGKLPTRDWTRRHLRERLEPALGRALQVRLDASLREALRAGFGIAPPELTPAWRDAARFYLSTPRNNALLGRLLRHAASQPGVAIARSLAANQAWIERAGRRFDVDAWLAPRSVAFEAGGRKLALATEDDPLEVLRMGIPFDTCLSLLDGCNAASTVLNALDANKRVLYLRDQIGTIVGRKLLAVSRSNELLGYQLYLALDKGLRPELERAVNALCREIAREARLPMGVSGAPAVIHQGFWYDDGAVPFAGSAEQVPVPVATEQFCASLGRPPVSCEVLGTEARIWAACRSGDVDAVSSAMSLSCRRAFEVDAARWLVDQLGEAAVLRREAEQPNAIKALLDRAFAGRPSRMLALLARLDAVDHRIWMHADDLLGRVADGSGLVRGLAEAARAQCGRTRFDDHNIEHGTVWTLPRLAALAPVAETLDALDLLAPVWGYVLQESPDCGDCVQSAISSLEMACGDAYARRPDPQAVIRCLGDPHRTDAALRVALHLAARFPFPRTARGPVCVPVGLDEFEGVPCGCPSAVQALRVLQRRKPTLARSEDFVAAVLRQSAPAASPPELAEAEDAPYEALADLAMHAPEAVARVLKPWSARMGEPPGPWELYHHRRYPTAWKRHLIRHGAGSQSATRAWLAVLGEPERDRDFSERRTKWHPPISSRDISRVRAAIEAQLAGDQVKRCDLPPEAIDPAFVRRALRHAAQACGDELVPAIQTLAELALPVGRWRAITEQLLERGASDAALAAAAAAWLPRCTWNLPELLPQLALELGSRPETREPVAKALGRLDAEQWDRWHARLQAVDPQPPGAGPFFEALYATWVRGEFDKWAIFSPELSEGLARAALASGPAVAVKLYESAGSFALASRLLDQLVARFSRDELKGCKLVDSLDDDELAARQAWLRAALEAQPVAPSATRATSSGGPRRASRRSGRGRSTRAGHRGRGSSHAR